MDAIETFEKEYPELSKEFKDIQDEMYAMFAAKHMDYGLQNISLGGDLTNENDKKFLDAFAAEPTPDYYPKIFKEMYNEDHLDNMIRNVDLWLKERFENLK